MYKILLILSLTLLMGCESLKKLTGTETESAPVIQQDIPPIEPASDGYQMASAPGRIPRVPVVWLNTAQDGAYLRVWVRSENPIGPTYGPWVNIPACVDGPDQYCYDHQKLESLGHHIILRNGDDQYQIYHVYIFNPGGAI